MFMVIQEGLVKIKTSEGVFYNPRMVFCRDLDVLVWKAISEREGELEFLDALSGTGVRGIRAKVESGLKPIFNDKNPKAVEIIKENLGLNGLHAEIHNKDACVLMRSRSFDFIDLDPFGSPAYFIDSASYSVKRYLSVTATDTSALCGSATESGLRKYFVFAEMTGFYPEVGLRALIGYIARCMAIYEKGLKVLVAWAREHYYRVHLEIKRSMKLAKSSVKNVGYLLYCKKCLNFTTAQVGSCVERCDCGNRFRVYGPLWLGDLKDDDFVKGITDKAEGKVKNFLSKIGEEINTPFGYNVHSISRVLKASPLKTDEIVKELRDLGFKASRVHYSGIVFKTDADFDVVKSIFSS
jgi:tRNA (guanine26-N2/guanine27-N2)-dimethyltransferase